MPLESELQSLSDAYEALRCRLFDGGDCTSSPSDPVLASEELIARVGQLDRRLAQIAAEWLDSRNRIDPARRAQIERLVSEASAHLRQLQRVCGSHVQKLEHAVEQISQELGELDRGMRYLASVRPIKNNFPKFVDSRC